MILLILLLLDLLLGVINLNNVNHVKKVRWRINFYSMAFNIRVGLVYDKR